MDVGIDFEESCEVVSDFFVFGGMVIDDCCFFGVFCGVGVGGIGLFCGFDGVVCFVL